jgi:hypothetical protein
MQINRSLLALVEMRNLDGRAVLNVLQDAAVVSDNCIRLDQVADADCRAACLFIANHISTSSLPDLRRPA